MAKSGPKISVYSTLYWTMRGCTEEEAKFEIGKRRPTSILYWLEKCSSKEDAEMALKGYQSRSSVSKTEEQNRKGSSRCVEYWINRGYTLDEAEKNISIAQSTFSKEICIKKYGLEEGTRIWQDRQDRWQSTLNSKTDVEKERIRILKMNLKFITHDEGIRLTKTAQSVEAIENLMPVVERCRLESLKYYGLDKKEWFIFVDDSFVSYDMFIPSKKLIIEYQGDRWHADPRVLNKDTWTDIAGNSWESVKAKDDRKRDIAVAHGYEYAEIWSFEAKQKIDNLIQQYFEAEIES